MRPSARLPSLYSIGTVFRLSSVVRIITGRTIIESVREPDNKDQSRERKETKNIKPNSPYTIEGIPASVSVVKRIIETSFPGFAYSTR